MNGHEQYAALLDAYIDGALSEQDAARVREHLAQCPECQSYVSDALTMRELFPGVEETEVPEGFLESVMSSLPAQKIVWRRQWAKIAAPLAACVAVALLIGGLSGLPIVGMGGAASMDSNSAAAETAEFDAETPLESAEAPEAELYSVTAADWDEEAAPDAEEYQAAAVTSDSGVTASQSALDGGGTSWSASERGAAAQSASGSGAAPSKSASGNVTAASRNAPASNGAAAKSAPDSGGAATSDGGAVSDSGTASESALDGGATPQSSSEYGAAARFASDSGGASASNGVAAAGSGAAQTAFDDTENVAATQSASGSDSDAPASNGAARNASAFDDTDADAPTSGAAFDTADAMPPQAAEAAPVPEPSEPNANASAKMVPQDTAALASAAPSDTAASGAYATEESAPEDMAATEAFPLPVSVWTLAPDAAPVIMERYPPDAVTDSGIWYALTAAEFDELCERFPDIEITSGPEIMDADGLPDGVPAPVDSDAIYVFAPTE